MAVRLEEDTYEWTDDNAWSLRNQTAKGFAKPTTMLLSGGGRATVYNTGIARKSHSFDGIVVELLVGLLLIGTDRVPTYLLINIPVPRYSSHAATNPVHESVTSTCPCRTP